MVSSHAQSAIGLGFVQGGAAGASRRSWGALGFKLSPRKGDGTRRRCVKAISQLQGHVKKHTSITVGRL